MTEKLTGRCGCGHIKYQLNNSPLFVHACHCSWCQRETGGAFAVNALIESTAVELTAHEPVLIDTPSESGKGQKIARCEKCQVALWSHYAGFGRRVSFIRVGTLDNPALAAPNVHIFTESKQAWFEVPKDTPNFTKYYDYKVLWPKSSQQRIKALYAER